jgi:predicted PurR-regulated permease PerM
VQVVGMVAEIDSLLSQFLRGQLGVMTALALYYSSALALAGFDSALPIGILTGMLAFVPYVGYSIGLVLALGAGLLQFEGWYGPAMVALVYVLGQVLEGFVLTPRLVGERIGLHPLAVIFALLAFAQLFGFFGVLVALPSSAVLLVALRRLKRAYFESAFYTRAN